DAGQALDGGAVEADALVEGAFEFGRGDGHRFEHAEYIGEPEPDEAHVAFLDGPQHVLLLFVHSLLLVSSAACSPAWCSPACARVCPARLSHARTVGPDGSARSIMSAPGGLGRDLLSGPATAAAPAAGPLARPHHRRR